MFENLTLAVVVATVFGTLIGSFLNVVIYRLPRDESLVQPGSHCTNCKKPVAAYDLIPIVSWLILGGRCRNCGEKVSVQYPLVEALTAALFGVTTAVIGFERELLLALPFVALMVAVTFIDIQHRIVPNELVVVPTVWLVVVSLLINPSHLTSQLIAGLIAGGLLLIVAFFYPGGMGMGDVKLTAVIGLYLGKAVAPALFIAFAVGSIVGVAAIIKNGPEARKTALPFAPFLAVGAVIGQLWGVQMVDYYTNNFLS